jgi:acyl-CoA thioesterase-1
MKFFLALMLVPGLLRAEPPKKLTLVFFGDSITAGRGLTLADAYPALVQKKIDALHWPVTVVNAGLSGDTTAAGEQRLKWVLRQKVDVLVIALGANDGLRGIAPEVTEANLQRMIDFARSKNPTLTIVLAGMKMPPNYGKDYAARFEATFHTLAARNKLPLIPFLLEGVGGIPSMNQGDGVHPTVKGQARIAETVWTALKPILAKHF